MTTINIGTITRTEIDAARGMPAEADGDKVDADQLAAWRRPSVYVPAISMQLVRIPCPDGGRVWRGACLEPEFIWVNTLRPGNPPSRREFVDDPESTDNPWGEGKPCNQESCGDEAEHFHCEWDYSEWDCWSWFKCRCCNVWKPADAEDRAGSDYECVDLASESEPEILVCTTCMRLVRNERQMKALLDGLDPTLTAKVIQGLRAMRPGQVTDVEAGEVTLRITRGGK